MRKDKMQLKNMALTFSAERNMIREKAIMQLENFKKIESNTQMYCTTYKGMRVCAKTEERLNEIINELKKQEKL